MENNGLYENAVRNISTDSFKRMVPTTWELESTMDACETENVDYDTLEQYRHRVTQNRPSLQSRVGGRLSHTLVQERPFQNYVRLAHS